MEDKDVRRMNMRDLFLGLQRSVRWKFTHKSSRMVTLQRLLHKVRPLCPGCDGHELDRRQSQHGSSSTNWASLKKAGTA